MKCIRMQQIVSNLLTILGIEGDFLYSKGHHMALLDKMKGNPEKAMVYDRKTLEKRAGL